MTLHIMYIAMMSHTILYTCITYLSNMLCYDRQCDDQLSTCINMEIYGMTGGDEWIDEWIDGWMGGWLGGWMDV